MFKFLTLFVVLSTSSTVFALDFGKFSTKDQVRAQLWFEGVQVEESKEIQVVERSEVKISEEILIPLLRMEKSFKRSVQN